MDAMPGHLFCLPADKRRVGGPLLPRDQCAEITTVSTSRLWCTPVKVGDEFVLLHTFREQAAGFPHLRAQGDHLVIVKSVFDAFGDGMPDEATDEGSSSVMPAGGSSWLANRPVPAHLRLGQVATTD